MSAPPPDVVAVDLADDEPVTPRFHRLSLPNGAVVHARVAGEGDPVTLSVPEMQLVISPPAPGHPSLTVSRDIAWALWAVLSDALMPDCDAIPDWAVMPTEPTDEHGRPIPDPIKIPF